MTRITALAAFLLLVSVAQAAEGWRYGASGEFVRDDNATRGLYDGKKADNILAAEAAATRSFLLSERSGALVRAAARYARYSDISDISQLALVGRAAWRYQPRRDFGAPWYELAGQGQLLRHADSELRDGSIWTVEGSVGSYLTDRTRVTGGLGLDQRSGGGTAGVYDLSQNRVWGTADVRMGLRNTLYARLTRLAGDHVFNVIPALGLGVWDVDPALTSVYGAPGNAYKVDATTFVYEIGFNYPLGAAQALDFSVTRHSSEVEDGIAAGQTYTGTQLRATYLHRFP